MDGAPVPGLRLAAWLLVAGGSLAFIGACWPPYKQWYAPHEEGLRIIAAHPVGWRCIHAGFLSGSWVCTIGLVLLAHALRGREGGTMALATAVLFGLSAVCFSVNIAFRLGVTPWAADELVRSGQVPAGYAPWRAFAGVLFAAFSVLAYLSVASSGLCALRAELAPRALATLLVAWGLSGGFVVGANVPVLAFIPHILLGGFLLRL